MRARGAYVRSDLSEHPISGVSPFHVFAPPEFSLSLALQGPINLQFDSLVETEFCLREQS